MKFKKSFSYSDKNQIWRLLIDNDLLLVETRNTDLKEVYFHSFDLVKGKKIFSKLQFEEKFWIGIEAVKNGIIYFHHYAKPNMPEHKKIIAYGIEQKQIIWQNDDLAFLTLLDEKIYSFKKKFEGQTVFAINALTGEIEEDLGDDSSILSKVMNESQMREDFSDYFYPESMGHQSPEIVQIINSVIEDKQIENLDSLVIDDFVCFNYYLRGNNNLLDNVFAVYNIDKKKKVLSETINKNLNSFSPDSFFGYKDCVLVLKNKNEIVSYKIYK